MQGQRCQKMSLLFILCGYLFQLWADQYKSQVFPPHPLVNKTVSGLFTTKLSRVTKKSFFSHNILMGQQIGQKQTFYGGDTTSILLAMLWVLDIGEVCGQNTNYSQPKLKLKTELGTKQIQFRWTHIISFQEMVDFHI